jgi:sulfur-oxidizing protein SoxY
MQRGALYPVVALSGLAPQECTMAGHVSHRRRPTDFRWTSFNWMRFGASWLGVASLGVTSLALALLLVPPAASFAATPDDGWASLAGAIFKGRPLADGTGLVGIEMPARAEDAAIVPVTMRVTLPAGDSRRLRALTLVIDENPVPVAATFTFGDGAGVSVISTRVRVDSYTNVHAVAELSDGKLYVVKTYVKASGGCSAPAAKSADEALAGLGQMQLRMFDKPGDGPASAPREAQIMIRHPNHSGLQRDQVTLLYTPANFVEELRLWQGDVLLLGMEAGISISENPSFRFSYIPNGAATFKVEARDSAGRVFRREWSASGM